MEDSLSWVDTSLDLSIGVNRLRVEDEPTTTTGGLVAEINQLGAENKKLVEALTVMSKNYNFLRDQLMDLINKNNAEREHSPTKKRKFQNGDVSESSSSDQDESCKKQREETVVKEKVSRVYYLSEASDTSLVVKDGYQWRKYGQKVTRDNRFPRAYFKCAFAPSCSVKKKVQRSAEDQFVIVATYEGEHNHPPPLQMEAAATGSSRYTALGSAPCATNKTSFSDSPITFDFTEPRNLNGNGDNSNQSIDLPDVRKLLVEQMASSLTKDPDFTAALAAAVSGRLQKPKNS